MPPEKLLSCPVESEWRHNNGFLCCGTLRIARADFDTNPSPEFQKRMFDWIIQQLNTRTPSPELVELRKLVEVLRASRSRCLDESKQQDCNWLIELPMKDDEAKIFRDLTAIDAAKEKK